MKLNVGADEIKLFLWEHSDSCMFGKQSLVVYEPTKIKVPNTYNHNSTDEYTSK